MKQGAGEAESLNRARRKRADLAIERFGKFETGRKFFDAIARNGGGKMVEAAKKEQVFPARQAGVEAEIAASVKSKLTADVARRLGGVMPSDAHLARGGKQE